MSGGADEREMRVLAAGEREIYPRPPKAGAEREVIKRYLTEVMTGMTDYLTKEFIHSDLPSAMYAGFAAQTLIETIKRIQ